MYAPFYNLVAEPFQLTPDHRFFFGSSVHNQALAHLTYGLNQGEGFIVITGDIGAGKTTLVAHLLATLDSRKYIAAKVVTTQLDADDLLRAVVTAFGVKADLNSKADMLRQFEAFLTYSHRSGKRCLLMIDEAQNLTASALEELRMLSNFQVGERAPLQSFILGQPQFRAVLNSPELEQLRQRIIANYHLGPLDIPETQSYIEHRLHTAGWKSDPALAAEVFTAIHHHTEGVPRRINNLCNRLFLYGFLEEKHSFDVEDVERVARDQTREENPDIRGKDLIGLPRDRVTITPNVAAVDELRQRMDAIEQRPAAAGDPRQVDDLRRRLDLIEEYVRLRSLADRAFEDLVRRVTTIEESATKAAPAAADPELERRLAAAEARLDKIAVDELADRIRTLESAGAIPAIAPELEQRVAAAEARLAQLAGNDLAERVRAIETAAAVPTVAPDLDQRLATAEALLAELAGSDLARRIRAIEEAATPTVTPELEQRVAAAEARLAQLGSNDLAERIRAIEEAAGAPTIAPALEQRLAAAEARLDSFAGEEIARRVRTIEDAKALPAITPEIEQRLAAAEAKLTYMAGENLGGRISAIEMAATAPATASDLTDRLAAVEATLRAAPRGVELARLADLEARLAAIPAELATRLDQTIEAEKRERAALAERHQTLEQKLARVGETGKSGTAAPADVKALADRLKVLEQRKPATADGDALAAIETRLRKLERKPTPAVEGIDVLRDRVAGVEATQSVAAALAGTVTELTNRLEGIDSTLRGLPLNGAPQDIAPRLAAIEEAMSAQQAMLRRAIGLVAGLLGRGRVREVRDAS